MNAIAEATDTEVVALNEPGYHIGPLQGGVSFAISIDAMAAVASQFGPYQIISLVGAGGMGEVYRARDPRLGRDVAVKILPAPKSVEPDAVARFLREARAIAALSHPGILTIYDVGEEAGQCYLVTELLEGDTLRQRLERGPLPWRQAVASATVIASALAAAHTRGIVHRDLKPANVFLTSGGAVKILDFGVAKLVPLADATTASSDAELTGTGAVIGTLACMAPEQLEAREIDHRTDQFAFGIVLYEMLSGRRPFPGETAHQVVAAILRDPPRSLASLCPDAPATLLRIVSRCLARDPSGRYASTTDLALALEDLGVSLDDRTRTVQHVVTSFRRRNASWLAGGLGAAVILTAAIVGGRWAVSGSYRGTVSTGVQAVSVLPFSTIGVGEPYLADGVTEAVTLELGRIKNARVIAANSAFAYRGRNEGFSEIGRELGVWLLVRGSVQRAGGRVRINVALVDTRQDATLWSESYDRDVTDVLGVQGEIAWQIAGPKRISRAHS